VESADSLTVAAPARAEPGAGAPRGDRIAFAKFDHAVFSIGVMLPEGKAERILSKSFGTRGRPACPG
jgi:hypothetical protein